MGRREREDFGTTLNARLIVLSIGDGTMVTTKTVLHLDIIYY
jgi:hypothetical protein